MYQSIQRLLPPRWLHHLTTGKLNLPYGQWIGIFLLPKDTLSGIVVKTSMESMPNVNEQETEFQVPLSSNFKTFTVREATPRLTHITHMSAPGHSKRSLVHSTRSLVHTEWRFEFSCHSLPELLTPTLGDSCTPILQCLASRNV